MSIISVESRDERLSTQLVSRLVENTGQLVYSTEELYCKHSLITLDSLIDKTDTLADCSLVLGPWSLVSSRRSSKSLYSLSSYLLTTHRQRNLNLYLIVDHIDIIDRIWRQSIDIRIGGLHESSLPGGWTSIEAQRIDLRTSERWLIRVMEYNKGLSWMPTYVREAIRKAEEEYGKWYEEVES